MSNGEENQAQFRRELSRLVAAWSDGDGYQQAVALSEQHGNLLPKPITNAQLSSLRNVVGAARRISTVRDFADNQKRKASRREEYDVRDYWGDVGRDLLGLRESAEALWAEAGGHDLTLSELEVEAAKNQLHLRMMRICVQHLVAHSLYLPVS